MLKGYITITFLLLIDLILYLTSGISFVGQVGERIIFWVWLILTPIVVVKYFKNKWTKWYLGLIAILLVLSLVPVGLPFIAIVSFAIDMDDERKIDNYTLREGAKSAIAIPKIYVMKNWGIFEKEVGETFYRIDIGDENYRLNEIDNVKLTEEMDSLSFEFIAGEESAFRKFGKT